VHNLVTLAHDLGGEEVLLDEAGQTLADLVLLARDDGGVRDRDPQRMAEQRSDGEPVGEPADHRRLGGCLDITPRTRTVAHGPADHVHHRGDQQQAAGDPFHPAQRVDAVLLDLGQPDDAGLRVRAVR